MRNTLSTSTVIVALATLIGCAHTSPTAPKLAVTPTTPAAPAATAVTKAPPAATITVDASAIMADEAAEAAVPAPSVKLLPGAPVLSATDAAAAVDAPEIDAAALAAAAPRALREGGGASAQNILDPWRPYGVGVVAKTHDTVTLAWRTDLDSKAMVYFGKSLGLSWHGYDGVVHDPNNAKFHQVTVVGLSRFRSYTFTVIGTGALGMQFPTYPFKVRTNLF